MRYLLQNFTGIFLIFSMLQYDSSYSSTSAYATDLNSSEEIKNIFNLSHDNSSVVKGAPGTRNFAEGGIMNENLTHSLNKTFIKKFHVNSTSYEKQRLNPFLYESGPNNTSHDAFESSTLKFLPRTKLTETGSNLFAGIPEIIHVNGTSSIKPRKGVQFIKIVPRKGVENESGSSQNESCLWLNENKCYYGNTLNHLDCVCCEKSNTLGKSIEQQATENCSNCKPVNSTSKNKQICEHICCTPIVHDIHSLSETHNTLNNYLSYETVPNTELKHSNVSEKSEKPSSVYVNDINTKEKSTFSNSKKNSKLKPSVTKVPYDVEVVTNLLSNSQQKVFIPIAVSLFLLPLIGILMFFVWRRAKEYWDKRYYKRMDFLIDGIYND